MKNKPSHFILLLTLLFSFIIVFSSTAQAESTNESKETSPPETSINFPIAYRYQPDHCDFTAAFPEKPLISEQCETKDDPASCFKLVSYTKVFDMASTIKVDVICNPSTPEMYEHFTPQIMENTISEMVKDNIHKTFSVSSSQKDGYRLSGLVGQGRKGLHDTLLIAQIWLSEKSIMSVEAEVSGPNIPEIDAIFAGILNNIGYAAEMNITADQHQ